jgi:autotransporter-associated beta strand protein
MLDRFGFRSMTAVVSLTLAAGIILAASTATADVATKYSNAGGGRNWTDSVWGDASGGPYTSAWVDGDDARFEAGSGTINVGTVSLCGISFQPGYTLSGGTMTLTGTESPFNTADWGYSSVNAFSLGGASNSATINSNLAGAGGLTKQGSGTIHLGGTATYSGDTRINRGMLAIDASGSLLMGVADAGASDRILVGRSDGNKSLAFNGALKLGVGTVTDPTGTWTLIDKTNVPTTFGSTFSVQLANGTAFTEASDVWTLVQGAKTWTFTEANGQLGLATVPEPNAIVLLSAGLVGLLAYAWRKRK